MECIIVDMYTLFINNVVFKYDYIFVKVNILNIINNFSLIRTVFASINIIHVFIP